MRLYYPLDDAIRNKGKLTLICPLYVKHFSQLLKIARKKVLLLNMSDDIIVPLDADVMNAMKRDNSNSQYKPITEICLTSMTKVKHIALTIDIRREVV